MKSATFSSPFLFVFYRKNVAEVIDAAPDKVSVVSPADSSTNIQLDAVITWSKPVKAQWYNVYFDTVNPPVTKVSDRQLARTYVPELSLDDTYYYRIDAGNPIGVTAGDVITFSTWSVEDILVDENDIPITDENGVYIEVYH